ncbi:hypothetical protein PY092_12450 [Muricauda sp. 334s03]|uniref:DUF6602 domain-containing protein n=1 Tax=Flagellimonas yonaguniensis TaxID=3031325 RepID=A0ABT5Y0I6_9FLAO|nr:DUF6602 domain-containing protein [[Muricauda] yonaguniensis]MDF0716964.1 hypothetical protein [[Muricauda] yonaguniensis]
MNAVIGSIVENLRTIKIVYEPTLEIFKGDRTNTGDAKEYTVNDFVQSYLTNDYKVKKGKIYSLESESANIDCVVLAPNHPSLMTPIREIILAEGVFCAIEVKPDISSLAKKSEFSRGLNQIKTVKNLKRKISKIETKIGKTNPKPDYFNKIPAAIFSQKSADFPKIIEHLRKKVENKELKIDELPDLIFSIDKGVLFYCPFFKHTHYYNNLDEVQKLMFDEAAFMHIHSEDKHIHLILFLIVVLNFEKPFTPMTDFFIKKYLNMTDIKIRFEFTPLNLDKLNVDLNPGLEEAILKQLNHGKKNP